jgi:hypothetical protein
VKEMNKNLEHCVCKDTSLSAYRISGMFDPLPLYAAQTKPMRYQRLEITAISHPQNAPSPRPDAGDQKLKQCHALHAFLVKTVSEHYHDRITREITRSASSEREWNDWLFDLQILKRAFELLERFYQEKAR